MAKVPHLVDAAGTNKLLIALEEATYQNIGEVVGITKLSGTAPVGSNSETSVSAVKKGKLGNLRVTLRAGTKRTTRKILCSLEKMDSVTGEIIGKTIGTGTITSARFPTRRRLR